MGRGICARSVTSDEDPTASPSISLAQRGSSTTQEDRFKKKFRRSQKVAIGAASVSLLLTLMTALPANASEGTVIVPPVQSQLSVSQIQDSVTTGKAQEHSWNALSKKETQSLRDQYVASGAIASSGLSFALEKSEAWRVDGGLEILRIPVNPGQGVTEQTSVSVFFDSSESLVGTTEFEFTPVSGVSGTVRVWANGELTMDQLVSAPAAGTKGEVSLQYTRGDWWGNFNECLSSAGIAAWVVTGIAIACAAICIITIGAGCLVCLGAASAGYSATVSSCIVIANNYT